MEKNLHKKLVNKDPLAIRQFVNDHNNVVFRTCMGYVQNEDDANDITQEVLIKAIQSIHQFKAKSSIKTWVTRIAINLSLNYIRDNKKHNNKTKLEKADYFLSDEESEPDYSLSREEIKKNLSDATSQLPERQQEAFILFHYNDYSYREISEITGDSKSSVESLLQRARKNLQKKLAVYYSENFL